MKKIFIILMLIAFSYSAINCSNQDEIFKKAYDQILKEKAGNDLFEALLDLDQKYPHRLELKVTLGGMLLAAGDINKAKSYLKRGEEIVRHEHEAELQATLFGNLAVLALLEKDYVQGLVYAEKSLEADASDKNGIIFIRAQCLLFKDDKKQALRAFELGWQYNRQKMNRTDMNLFIDLLIEMQNYKQAWEVIIEYQIQFEYFPGMGLSEAVILEKLGKVNEGIIAAFMDLEYQKYRGLLSSEYIVGKLSELEQTLDDTSWNPQGLGYDLIKGLRYFVLENYKEAGKVLAAVEIDHPFYQYILLVCALEIKGANAELLEQYVALEKYCKGFISYYYHFWRGMKKGEGKYDLETARFILEKCILLAPDTEYAKQTRRELARLLGLEESDGEKLLLGSELDLIFSDAINDKDLSAMQRVMDLLSISDNVYTVAATMALRDLVRENLHIKTYLEEQKDKASGRLRERLIMILEG